MIRNLSITKKQYDDWGGATNRQLFCRQSPNGTWRYYRIDKS